MSVRVITGDCRRALMSMPDRSVQMCVTSPPYFNLRDYGIAGQIGLEITPAQYVAAIVDAMRHVKRVLADDGTLWLNLGDTYAPENRGENANPRRRSKYHLQKDYMHADLPVTKRFIDAMRDAGIRRKQLLGIPWMVAKAMQEPFYAGKITDERDRIWLAAIIDGEGCFFIHRRRAGASAHSRFQRADGTIASYRRTADTFGVGLEICNTSRDIIDRVASIVPSGSFTTQGPEKNGRRKQRIYRWRVSPNETKRLAQELYPHLVAKQHQARLIFSCPSNGAEGAEAHQAMMDLHNGVATKVDYPQPPSLFEPGWILRQDIIWGKPNPMPEPVTDRCVKAHEYIFLFAKRENYYFDHKAIAEPATKTGTPGHLLSGKNSRQNVPRTPTSGNIARKGPAARGATGSGNLAASVPWAGTTRNKRSVWTVPVKPFDGAHFATFPDELIAPCVLAGSRAGDTILDPFAGAGTFWCGRESART